MATATSRRIADSPNPQASGKRLCLSDVKKGGSGLPPRVVLHGQSGIGKSSWAAWAEAPIFLFSPQETGLLPLIDAGSVPSDIPHIEVPDWLDLLGLIEELRTAQHQRKHLILDTADGMEKLGRAYTCAKDYNGDWSEKGFEGFKRGYMTLANGPWRELLAALDRLRTERNMGIVLLCHTDVANFQNPMGPDFNRYEAAMNKYCWRLTVDWSDIVLFATREIYVGQDRGERKAKAKGASERIIKAEWSVVADAKNRYNLPEEISMGASGKEAWSNFQAALAAGKNGQKKEEVTHE
jgi:hypothetical protein